MTRRPCLRWLTPLLALGLGLLGPLLGAPGCSSSRRGGVAPPALGGMVLDYREEPAAAVPLLLGAGLSGSTRSDGMFALGPSPTGAQLLRVGDSIQWPTLLVPAQLTGDASYLERPVYLPDLESGISRALSGSVAAVTTVSGDALPGVTLRLDAGASVSIPAGRPSVVRVLGVSPSRLPSPLPGGRVARVAFLVEPHGASFSGTAVLSAPRLDPAAAAPYAAWRVNPSDGRWEQIASGLPAADQLQLPVTAGTLYAFSSEAASPTVTVTGRVVAGTQPVAGFRVSCWNLTSAETGPDGLFRIDDVPSDYGVFLLRAYPARPGALFAPRVAQSLVSGATAGDLAVSGEVLDTIRPRVKATEPADDAKDVDVRSHVVVTFSEAIDPSLPETFRVTGPGGQVAGRLLFENAFTARLIPSQRLDPGARYVISVDDRIEDLAGNALESQGTARSFTTKAGTPAPPPTDTLAFALTPTRAAQSETVTVVGRNFAGATTVFVGGTQALVTAETAEEIAFTVPDFEPAGLVQVQLSNGGQAVPTQRALDLDLRGSVSVIYSGASPDVPLAWLDRTQPPAQVVAHGHNLGGTSLTIDGVSIAAVDSLVLVGGKNVATGRTISLGAPAPASLLTGPLVARSPDGRVGRGYGFIQVRD